MSTVEISNLGYLSPRVRGNQSPVVHLECGGNLLNTDYKRWGVEDFRDYLLYVSGDAPTDSFFKAFLLSPNRARSGRFLNPLLIGFEPPSNQLDWVEWLNELFAPQGNLPALKTAIPMAGSFPSAVDVWVTLPYPEWEQKVFGVVYGCQLDFTHQRERILALEWWLEQFAVEWAKFDNVYVRFRGFRWARESILESDLDLVKEASDRVHDRGWQLMYLTNYGSAHALDWADLGFDLALIHPNYYGNTSYQWNWIDNAAYFSMYYHTGLQLTYGRGLLYDENHIFDYLNRGLTEYRGYMNEAFTLFNFDRVGIRDLYQTRPDVYCAIHSFVKGIYQKRSYPGITY